MQDSREPKEHGDRSKDSVSETELSKPGSSVMAEVRNSASEYVSNQQTLRLNDRIVRNQSLAEELQSTGKVTLGVITRNFNCGVEISDGKKVLVKGRSPEEIEKVAQMKQASEDGMLLGAGGKFVSDSSNNSERFKNSERLAQAPEQHLYSEIKNGSRPNPNPNAESFLKEHPELALSPAQKEAQLKQVNELGKQLEKFHELPEWLTEHNKQFKEHIYKATGSNSKTPPDAVQAAFDKLPAAQRKNLSDEYHVLQNAQDKLNKLPQMEGKHNRLKSQAEFADNLAKIDKSESPELRQKLYASLDTILNQKNETHPVPDARRQAYANALADHIANRELITQGQSDTCGPASVQRILLDKDPGLYAEEAAQLVSSGALLFHGEKSSVAGTAKKETLLSPAQLNGDDGNPQRDPLSAAMQSAFADKMVKLYDPGKGYHYIDARQDIAPKIDTSKNEKPYFEKSDSGEYVTDKEGHNYPFRGSNPEQEAQLLHAITGKNYKFSNNNVNSLEDLEHALQNAGKKGFPIMLGITAKEGSHSICITDYDQKSGQITVSNSARFPSEKLEVQSTGQFYQWLKNENAHTKRNTQKKVVTQTRV